MGDATPETDGLSSRRRNNSEVPLVPADRIIEAKRSSTMVNPITSATHTDPATASTTQTEPVAKSATSSQKSAQTQPQSTTSTSKDTVHISSAAQAAVQEALETQAQTVKEAGSGDQQAQRLLAKEAAAKKTGQ
jgi:hypothetical protein